MTLNSTTSFAPSTLSSPSRGGSVLDRASITPGSTNTPLQPQVESLQCQVDGLVGGFAEQATDWRSLAAMTAGGMAYRAGRVGVMSLGNESVLRAASLAMGLTAEVSTFELTHRALSTVGTHGLLQPNLWRWNGQGGIHQGLLQSFVTFGTLKGAGHLASGENFFVQHLMQDSAMVLGHNASAALGIAPRPTGSLAEQFLHAEATNLQIGAGMALAHRMAPDLHALERGLDLSLSAPSSRPEREGEDFGRENALAFAGAHPSSEERSNPEPGFGPFIMQMSSKKSAGNRGAGRERTRGAGRSVPSAPVAEPARQQARAQLETVTADLEALYKEYEKSLEGVRLLLLQNNRKSSEHWEIYDRLLLRHSFISRKHQIGATALVPGGGAEKWPIARLEQAIPSLQRALVESGAFFEALDLPRLPEVPDRPLGYNAKSWEETIRMFRHLNVDSSLIRRLLKSVVPERRRQDAMLLMGLEGLHGLLNERPKDECQAVVELLDSIVNGNGQGFEMLHQLLILTMNFQNGLLSRSEIMQVIRDGVDFHKAYPNARGPFLELFTRRLLVGSREATLVDPLLNFARQHLGQNETVILEPRSSIHQGTLMTESPSGERFRYAAGGILKEVRSYHQFRNFAERFAVELVKAWEAEPRSPVRQAMYIEISRLHHDVDPERLKFWGRRVLEEAVALALHEVITADTEAILQRREEESASGPADLNKLIRVLTAKITGLGDALRALEESQSARDLRLQLQEVLRQYWNAFHISLDRIEIAYGNNPRRRQVIQVGAEEMGTDFLITHLQEEIGRADPKDPTLPKKHLLLAHYLNDVGRHVEAVEFLRSRLSGQPHKRIREFYRDLFQEALEEIFPTTSQDPPPSRNYTLHSKEILSFLSLFFDAEEGMREDLGRILTIRHPKFELGTVGAERNADALRLHFPVLKFTSVGSETIGEFVLDLNLPQNESKLIAQLSRADIYIDERGQSAAVFVMDRIFELLRALKISELRVEGDDEGKYAWLRMGGEFLRDEDRVRAATVLQVANLQLPSGYSARVAPTPLIAHLWASLPLRDRQELLSSWPGSPVYRFSVEPGSPEMGRFRQYLEEKLKATTANGTFH